MHSPKPHHHVVNPLQGIPWGMVAVWIGIVLAILGILYAVKANRDGKLESGKNAQERKDAAEGRNKILIGQDKGTPPGHVRESKSQAVSYNTQRASWSRGWIIIAIVLVIIIIGVLYV